MIHKLAAIAAVLSIATAAGACGGDDNGGGDVADSPEQEQVLMVLERLQEEGRQGNGGRICRDLFTKELSTSIRKAAASKRCGTEVNRNLASPQTSIETSKIDVDEKKGTAVASIKDQTGKSSKIFLFRNGQEWRIGRIDPA